jgi:Cu2+-exporting ATPase
MPGVQDVQINYVSQKARIQFDPSRISLAGLLHAIERIGYGAWPFEPSIAIEKAKKELLEKTGVGFQYKSLIGDRKPPLDFRKGMQ